MPDLPSLWDLSLPGALIGVVVFAYLAVVRGWIIPKSTHERELQAANKRGDEWKDTSLRLEDVNKEIRAQNTALIEGARTSAHFFSTVPIKEAGDVET